MAIIHCYSNKCIKNKYEYCTANNLEVLGENAHSTNETYCNSYEHGNVFKSVISNMGLLSANTGVIGGTQIYCNANNCFHNKDGSCNAKNLQFKPNGVNDSGSCITFVEAY